MKLYDVDVVAPDHLSHKTVRVLARDFDQAEHRALLGQKKGSYAADMTEVKSPETKMRDFERSKKVED